MRRCIVAIAICVGFAADAREVKLEDYGEEGKAVAQLLVENHYTRRALNDALSREWLQRYFDLVDPGKRWFLREDLSALKQRFGDSLDDSILTGDVRPAEILYDRLRVRVRERIKWIDEILQEDPPKSFDFTGNDTGPRQSALDNWPDGRAAADAVWTRVLRAEVLAEKLRSGGNTVDARARVGQRYGRLAKQLLEANAEQVFDHYVTALARCFDGHCEYFGDSELSRFRTSGGRQVGIGALLRMSNAGLCRVEQVLRGGPADLGGLHEGDRLVAIAQHGRDEPVGNAKFEDLIRLNLEEIVEHIRGWPRSRLTLKVIPAMSTDPGVVSDVFLVRDLLRLGEKRAQAAVLEVGEKRVGWLDPRGFYKDFADEDGIATSRDLAVLISQLENEGVQGLVLDLRRNRGGSLAEGLNTASLFIGDRPAVRVRKKTGTRDDDETHRGDHKEALYSGPLVVLVDSVTASTSEVVAAALQDYGRAVVVGSSATMGSGAVRTFYPLEKALEDSGIEVRHRAGALRVTVCKYYSPSGKAIQGRGVVPDVALPWGTDFTPRESDLPNPLPYDEVDAIPGFKPIAKLESKVQPAAANPERIALQKKLVALRDAPEISLNEEQRRLEIAEIGKMLARLEKLSDTRSSAKVRKRYSVSQKGEIVDEEVEADSGGQIGADGDTAIRVLLDLIARSG